MAMSTDSTPYEGLSHLGIENLADKAARRWRPANCNQDRVLKDKYSPIDFLMSATKLQTIGSGFAQVDIGSYFCSYNHQTSEFGDIGVVKYPVRNTFGDYERTRKFFTKAPIAKDQPLAAMVWLPTCIGG
jgi:hypothetical protein